MSLACNSNCNCLFSGKYLCTEHQIPSDPELDDGKGWDFYYECEKCFDKTCCGNLFVYFFCGNLQTPQKLCKP